MAGFEQMLISGFTSLGSAALSKSPMTPNYVNPINYGQAFDGGPFTVATGSAKASASLLPEMDWKLVAVAAIGALVLWKIANKR